jgi:sulfide:quinone oxidoreductase
MAGRAVVVLGGGVGGVVAANELRRRLDPADRVTVVEREARHLFQPSLLWLLVGRRQPERISCPLRDLLTPGIELVGAEVRAIDPAARRVETSGGPLGFDALVVALGAELAPGALPGFGDAAHNIFSVAGAAACSRELAAFRGGRLVVVVSALPYKCPAAPYEATLLIEDELRRRGVRSATELELYTPEPAPMPVAGPAVGDALVALLRARGIGFHPTTPIARFEPGSRELVLADGARVPYDLLAGVPPHRPPSALWGSGLVNESGWVAVDRGTLRTAADGVYAVGDATAIRLTNGKPLPKAGVFAHAEALVVARRIAADLGARQAAGEFDGYGYCWVETGRGAAAFGVGNFFAEPDPAVALRGPNRAWHAGKVLFERHWLARGLERRLATLGLNSAAKLLGIRARL